MPRDIQKPLLILALLVLISASPACAETLDVPGTGACEEIVKAMALVFNAGNPGMVIRVPESVGSSGGIRKVRDGSAVMARVARRPRGDEGAGGMTYIPFARVPVVFATGKGTGVRDLSPEQLAGIYSGSVTNWKDVGGTDAPVLVVTRERDETSFTLIRESLPGFGDIAVTPRARMLYHDHDVVLALENFYTAIGFSTLSNFSQRDIPALSIGGVVPSPDNIRSGAYPLALECAFVYADSVDGLARAWLDFVFSETGRNVQAAYGMVWIAREE